MKHGKKIGCAVLALVLVVLPVTVGLVLWDVLHEEPQRRLERLLRADPGVEVKALVLWRPAVRVEFNDPDAVRYLTDALRKAEYEGHTPKHRGTDYQGRVNAGTRGSAFVHVEVAEGGGGMTLGVGSDDPEYYWVPLPEPRPANVGEAFRRLGKPIR